MTDPKTFPAALDAERMTKDQTAATSSGPPAEPRPSQWPARRAAFGRASQRALSHARVRLTLLGLLLILLAAVVVTDSAWTAPLIVVGVLTLVVAWFGSRLDGRLVLEWGKSGATFELRAEVNPPEHPTQRVPSLAVARRLGTVPDDAEVIEGSAHTVEIDVAELKALIALAEAA
jgi:hypothetical protein